MRIDDLLRVAIRRWLPLLLCLAGSLGGALAYLQTANEQYESSVRLFVNVPTSGNVQDAVAGVQLTGNLLSSYAQIIQSDLGAEAIRTKLGLAQGTTLPGLVEAEVEPNTLLIRVKTTAARPFDARRLADAAGASLAQILEGLNINKGEAIQVRVIDKAKQPLAPASPNRPRAVLLAVLGGLVLGAFMATLFEAFDKRLRHAADARIAARAGIVTTVPRSNGFKRTPLVAANTVSPMAEAYRALRTSLTSQFAGDDSTTIVVTSPGPSEGKTTTISNLALVCAQAGMRTCLVDGDLRGPRLHDLFGLERQPGLVDMVFGSASLGEVTQQRFGMDIIPSGPGVGNPSELLNSQRMADVLELLRQNYDLVLIDAPPMLPVTDAAVLAKQVDGVLLVVAHGQTTRPDVEKTSDLLSSIAVTPLGVVYNKATGGYPYGYGYGHGHEAHPARS